MTQEDILKKVAVNVNGVADIPAGDELTAWQERLNEAYQEWALAYEPQVLIKEFKTSMAQSAVSIALPDDFKEKFAGYVIIGGKLYEEFSPTEAVMTSGKFVIWGGNKRDGYYLNTKEALTTTSEVKVTYHSRPTSLATLTSVVLTPNHEFLTARTTEKVMLQRGQPEYVEFQVKADLLLQRMVASEASQDIQRNKTIRTQHELNNFVVGED